MEGPVCHEDNDLPRELQPLARQLPPQAPDRPAIFVGTGTCGLGAGAAKTLTAVKAWMPARAARPTSWKSAVSAFASWSRSWTCSFRAAPGCVRPGHARTKLPPCWRRSSSGKLPAQMARLPAPRRRSHAVGRRSLPGRASLLRAPDPLGAGQLRHHRSRPASRNISPAAATRPSPVRSKHDTRQELCDMVEKSGLRGRGGGGFPTGQKWKFALDTTADQKYLICNADEGDPGRVHGPRGDRGRSAPAARGHDHRGLRHRREQGLHLYPRRISAGHQAARRTPSPRRKSYGLLGENILDSGFNLEIMIKMGAGAFVCGEETALIHSIEGKRGMPRPRPPFPAVSGLFGKPTVINNVETLANVPDLCSTARTGSAPSAPTTSKGTKVFALSGKVEQHRPGRSADGHHAARDHLRYRRRHPQRQEVQGRADRRPLRRLHPDAASGHRRSITSR